MLLAHSWPSRTKHAAPGLPCSGLQRRAPGSPCGAGNWQGSKRRQVGYGVASGVLGRGFHSVLMTDQPPPFAALSVTQVHVPPTVPGGECAQPCPDGATSPCSGTCPVYRQSPEDDRTSRSQLILGLLGGHAWITQVSWPLLPGPLLQGRQCLWLGLEVSGKCTPGGFPVGQSR